MGAAARLRAPRAAALLASLVLLAGVGVAAGCGGGAPPPPSQAPAPEPFTAAPGPPAAAGTAGTGAGAAKTATPPGRAGGPDAAGPEAGERAAPSPPSGEEAPFSERGVARGEVARLSFGAGLLTIVAEGQARSFRATPGVLRTLSPGEAVALPFRVWGGIAWVDGDDAAAWDGRWTVRGTLTGPVTAVERARGVLAIAGRTLHAHPALLVGVVPGERVSLAFVRVGGVDWVVSVKTRGGAPP